MGKKPVAKGKAKAKAKAEPEPEEEAPTPDQIEAKRLWQQRREATKWAQAQVEVARAQLAAAQKRKGSDWLQASHEFHEVNLLKIVKRLGDKELDEVPQSVRDDLQAYLAQCASNPEVEQDGFREMREIWQLFDTDGPKFVRQAETAESEAAIERLKTWTDTSEKGIADFAALAASHATSGGAQEAALVRLGGLFAEVQKSGADAPGLTCAGAMPVIDAAMKAHAADAMVQRAGCMAMRGVAIAPGQLGLLRDAGGIQLAVAAVNAHFKEKEVGSAGNSCFWAMAKAAEKASPELATMREAGVIDCLAKVMNHWAWDQTLCGQIRLTIPFIKESE